MEIAIVVTLFLIGTVGGAMQAMKYLDRRNRRRTATRPPRKAQEDRS